MLLKLATITGVDLVRHLDIRQLCSWLGELDGVVRGAYTRLFAQARRPPEDEKIRRYWGTKRRALAGGLLAGTMMSLTSPATAQSSTELIELRQQLLELQVLQQKSNARIEGLERALAETKVTEPIATPEILSAKTVIGPVGASAIGGGPTFMVPQEPTRLAINGDMRVRYELNFGDTDARRRDRGVLRARVRATYKINNWSAIGGQITTGDDDDPNSTDVTLSNFDDDLKVSLDQAYARLTFGNLQIFAGKVPQPFVRTDLVWDGDVSPQGISASYKVSLAGGAALKANGLYFLIDEAVAGPNSDMIGGQLAIETASGKQFKFEFAAGYYDYQLRSLGGSDLGDTRTNLILASRYASDFNLLDVVGAATYNGLGERWPVRLVGNYVHNFGASVSPDSGFGVDILVGRASKKGDWRIGYGYAQTGVDAVFAAFSQDNTNIATNYLQHTLWADFMLAPNIALNATYYHYKPQDAVYAGSNDPLDWLDRVRMNFLINF